jgi:hypothetical protein
MSKLLIAIEVYQEMQKKGECNGEDFRTLLYAYERLNEMQKSLFVFYTIGE